MAVERRVVLGGLLTIVPALCCSRHAFAETSGGGCWVPGGSAAPYFASVQGQVSRFETGSEKLEPRSGNPDLDYALAQALANLSELFGVLPGFCYYDDSGSPNALATSDQLLDRTDGTVMMGLSFLGEMLRMPERPDASIVAVCAHEFGHIVSYKTGLINQLKGGGGVFRSEQFADYMAGYFAGTRKLLRPDYPAVVFASTQNYFGGGDHGSSSQRGEAVQAGFMAAYQRKLGMQDATQAGLQFCLGRSL